MGVEMDVTGALTTTTMARDREIVSLRKLSVESLDVSFRWGGFVACGRWCGSLLH